MIYVKGISGLAQLTRNINREIEKIEKRTQAGLTAALEHVKGEALRITPRRLGNLVSSAYVITPTVTPKEPSWTTGRKGASIARLEDGHKLAMAEASEIMSRNKKGEVWGVIGYSAYYGVYVHEMPASNKWTTPGTGPKFLEIPLKENANKMISIIKSYLRKK